MEMIVRTKDDFEKAVKEQPEKIIFEGELADKIQKAIATKKRAKKIAAGGLVVSALAAVGGIIAAPVTGGLSLGATALSVSNLIVTTGGVAITLTAVELLIVSGVVVVALGVTRSVVNDLLKNYDNMKVGPTGVEFIRKTAD